MADKSQLRLCPTRMASGGRIFLKSFWTSSRRVVTSSSISGVIPEYLSMIGYHKKVHKSKIIAQTIPHLVR